jgi:hypothetical protein
MISTSEKIQNAINKYADLDITDKILSDIDGVVFQILKEDGKDIPYNIKVISYPGFKTHIEIIYDETYNA